MTTLDPRTPVIVGAAQIADRGLGSEPIDLMTRATEAALADAGAPPRLRDAVDAVRVVWGVWPYRDPGRLVAGRLGVGGRVRTTLTTMGGNQVYDLVADTATRIARGADGVTVVCAAETLRTRRADHARGERTAYLAESDDARPDEVFGSDRPLSNDAERAVGIDVVARFYAMAETALRHRLGEPIDAHRRRVAELWAGASAVAAANPHAWARQALTADEIATEGPANRPVASPYLKLMTSNLNVDQGGAVVLCSAATAERLGVPRDRWVFPWAAASAGDASYPTNRWALDASPAMRIVGSRTLELAGVTVDDCELLDLYSCFPVAVQVAQRELGIDPTRPFTITGGLTFAAGPLNCYCVLPLARAVEQLRERPGATALLTGNGGSFTKHSALLLAARPSAFGFRHAQPQREVDALPQRPSPDAPVRRATLESYTVTFDRDRHPERAIVAALDDAGHRHWAVTDRADAVAELLAGDRCGANLELDGGQGGTVTTVRAVDTPAQSGADGRGSSPAAR